MRKKEPAGSEERTAQAAGQRDLSKEAEMLADLIANLNAAAQDEQSLRRMLGDLREQTPPGEIAPAMRDAADAVVRG